MNDGFRRFAILLFVFLLAFVAVVALRRLQSGERFADLFQWGEEDPTEFRSEPFTLPERAALDMDDVEMLHRMDAEYARLSEAVVPSVVSIDTAGVKREQLRDLFGRVLGEYRSEVTGIGSGVIVTKEGHVVTNNHVINDKSRIRVTLNDGQTYPAHLIGQDPGLDIAVIRIDAKREFQPLSFGDSDRVRTGQLAFAIGNPFGLGETVTQGIISAKERSISDTQRDLFQTDAAINPGNSGGPLVNLFGEIIGINVAIYSADTQSRGSLGVGFSLPSNDVEESFLQILKRGRPVRGYLGVKAVDLSPRVRQIVKYQGEKGAVVYSVVRQSPAEKAGLKPEDVIVDFGEHEVESRGHLFTMIQRSKVDEQITMKVSRRGDLLQLKTTIVDAVDGQAAAREEPAGRSPSDREISNAIGLTVQNLPTMEQRIGGKGVIIAQVLTNSLAHQRGLRPGDHILSINERQVSSTGDFYARLLASAAAQPTTILVRRGATGFRVSFPRVPRSNDPAG
jgi:serine protease Do